MKNMLKVFGIIALVAVIGFSMTACEDEDTGGTYRGNTINSGSPPKETMSKYGITNSDLQKLLKSARAADDDPDYKGYYEFTYNYGGYGSKVSYSMMGLIWYNKDQAKYKKVRDTCRSTVENNDGYWMEYSNYMDIMNGGDTPDDTIGSCGMYYKENSSTTSMFINCVQFYKTDYDDVPKNTLVVVYMKITSDNDYDDDDDDW